MTAAPATTRPARSGGGPATAARLKVAAGAGITRAAGDIVAASHRIHARPELAFEEHFAAALLGEELAGLGYGVEAGVGGLPTAFAARRGAGKLHVALLAEYDALPEMGHACGHNIIAASAVGAAAALAPLTDELDCTVSVIGTPAEEHGAGKVLLLEAGVFAGVHAALMVHPGPFDVARPVIAAMAELAVHAKGRAAHAAAAPHLGISAADALVVGQTALGLLRAHLMPGDVVHGIVTGAGSAVNVVPDEATARYVVRAPDRRRRDLLRHRVERCFAAGGMATGARVRIEAAGPPLDPVRPDDRLLAAFEANMAATGRTFAPAIPLPISTDMGNVSQVLPAIHPIVGIGSWPAVNHQPAFAAAAVSAGADAAIIDAARALACTVIDAATDPDERLRLETHTPSP